MCHALAVEPHATDSYQNLLFSVFVFIAHTGHPPCHVTLVSHAFKEKRFVEMHCPAIRWPLDRFTFVGVGMDKDEEGQAQIERGEKRAIESWKGDPYGVDKSLEGKRRERGWTGQVVYSEVKDVQKLVVWKGGETGTEIYPEQLPWTK